MSLIETKRPAEVSFVLVGSGKAWAKTYAVIPFVIGTLMCVVFEDEEGENWSYFLKFDGLFKDGNGTTMVLVRHILANAH